MKKMTKKFQFQQNENVPLGTETVPFVPLFQKICVPLPCTGTIKTDTGMEEERLRLAIGAALMAGRDVMEI